MNSGLRRRAVTLGALLVYRIGTHGRLPGLDPREGDRLYCAGGAGRLCSGTRIGLLTYLIAMTVPSIDAAPARTLGRNEAVKILRRAAAVAG